MKYMVHLSVCICVGGQLQTTTSVENFPGFPTGIDGPLLCEQFRQQSINYGTKVISETIQKVNLQVYPFVLSTKKKTLRTRSLIIATGKCTHTHIYI